MDSVFILNTGRVFRGVPPQTSGRTDTRTMGHALSTQLTAPAAAAMSHASVPTAAPRCSSDRLLAFEARFGLSNRLLELQTALRIAQLSNRTLLLPALLLPPQLLSTMDFSMHVWTQRNYLSSLLLPMAIEFCPTQIEEIFVFHLFLIHLIFPTTTASIHVGHSNHCGTRCVFSASPHQIQVSHRHLIPIHTRSTN